MSRVVGYALLIVLVATWAVLAVAVIAQIFHPALPNGTNP